jgi:hypothetical protein
MMTDRDMEALTDDTVATRAIAILLDHQADINKCLEIMRTSSTITARRLRALLLPILNRWGIGRDKDVWTYPMVGDNTQILANEVVEVSGSAYGLDRLHWDLFHALFVHYEASTGYLCEYLEPIPPPNTVSYVWVMSRYEPDGTDDDWGTLTVDGIIPCSITAELHPLLIREQQCMTYYHGPITQEYYQDVVDSGGNPVELVQYLSTYKAGPNGTWVLDRDWDYGIY